jgi:hypothetical protein
MLRVLNGTLGTDFRAEHKRALVTLTIGDKHRRVWEKLCRHTWLSYAARMGFDIVQITAKFDTSAFAEARSPAWQKCLILDQPWAAQYERIVFLDCDIVITGRALDVTESVPDPACVGLCVTGAQMSAAERQIYLERCLGYQLQPDRAEYSWAQFIAAQFRSAGIAVEGAPMFNTGVLVLSPAHHGPLLRDVYYQPCKEGRLYEQPALSLAIWQRGLQTPLSARYNWNMHEARTLRYVAEPDGNRPEREIRELVQFIYDEAEKAYFLHFSAYMVMLELLADQDRQPW